MVWKHLYKTIYQGVQENIVLVILNVIIFCVQTKVLGNIKFCCLIITLFLVKQKYFFSSSSISKENTEKCLKVPHECYI